jgi:hypothetical protein
MQFIPKQPISERSVNLLLYPSLSESQNGHFKRDVRTKNWEIGTAVSFSLRIMNILSVSINKQYLIFREDLRLNSLSGYQQYFFFLLCFSTVLTLLAK